MARKKKKEGEERAIAVFNPVAIGNGENGIVKKAEQLVTSRYSLTTTEVKIISCLISMVRVSDTEFTEYAFKVADWRNEQDLKRKDIYKAFEEIAIDLMKKPITIKNEENGEWLIVNWVSSAKYILRTGIVKFRISDELKPYLLELKKHFLQYDIKNILPLKSAYSIRMYELLKDWYSVGNRYNKSGTVKKIVELEWLKQTFVIPEGYKYGHIKKQILQKAAVDLAKHTDITFEFEEIKTVRKVTHIKFFIQQKLKQISKIKTNKTNYKTDTARQTAIAMLALLPKQYRTAAAEKLMQKYHSRGVEYIKAQTEYASKAEPKNYLAYLRNALQNDYAGVEKSDLTGEIKEVKQAEAKEQTKARQEEEEEIKRLEDFYGDMRDEEKEQIRAEALIRLHEKHPNAPAKSATFGELSVEITIRKILRERLDK